MSMPPVELKPGDMVTEIATSLILHLIAVDPIKGTGRCVKYGPKGGKKLWTIPLSGLRKTKRRGPLVPVFV